MAFNRSTSANRPDTGKYINLADFPSAAVSHVRQLSDTCIVFTLELCPGLSLYNVRLIASNSGGNNWVSASQHKGKNGTWYNDYGLFIAAADVPTIENAVFTSLDTKDRTFILV